ncbi:MAG: SPASM domain-containing protein, partial [Bacteroidales bacterium]|nr:SPASM domain-containing protein [Bacteroidales bacterium]
MKVGQNIWDNFNLIKKVTVARAWNYFLLELSYRISIIKKKPLNWALPSFFSVEPNNTCNLSCPECPAGGGYMARPSGYMSWDIFKHTIDQFSKTAIYLNLYFQGEPFLHSGIFNMIKLAQQKKLYVTSSTNAHFLDRETCSRIIESGLDKLVISLDGVDQKTYQLYRKGGNIDKVMEGIKNIVFAKKKTGSRKPFIELQFLVLGSNEHQTKDIRKLARKLNVDKLSLKTAQIYDYQKGNVFIPENEAYSRYKEVSPGKYVIKSKLPNRCHRMWSSCVVTQSGEIVPCCFDKDAKHQMGNIIISSLKEIWYSEDYQQFRQRILSDRNSIEMCRN